MRLQSLLNAFTRWMPNTSTSENASQSSPSFNARNTKSGRIGSLDTWASYDAKTCRSDATDLRGLTSYLPHTLITSDLGEWNRTFRLHFSHFLPEDPSIAVFSESQDAPVPTGWGRLPARRPWRLNIRYRWRKGKLQIRNSCTVRVIVGCRWEYKIPPHAVRHWRASEGMLLVDWSDMYDDYFAQDTKKSNRRRAHAIVRRFRKLEEKTLVRETGALWSSYGDWDIQEPTAADVALACRYEGRGFENGLDPLKKNMSLHELGVRLKNLSKTLEEIIAKRVARERGHC